MKYCLFFFHKWSRWGEVFKRHFQFIQYGMVLPDSEHTQDWQKRCCEQCGKVQMRRVSE